MGYPGLTVELPRADPDLRAAVLRTPLDPWQRRAALAALLDAPPAESAGPPCGHLTATAWVLSPGLDQVLLLRHRTLGWSCPGGHVDVGEAPRVTAARELEEETGLRLEPVLDEPTHISSFVYPAKDGHPPHEHWSLGFVFVADTALRLRAERADEPAAWFPVSALPAPRVSDIDTTVPLLAALLGDRTVT